MVPRAHPSHQPKRHLDRFSRFRNGSLKAMLYNALSMGKKTSKIVQGHFLWDFVTTPEEDGATAIGNIHKTFNKDRASRVWFRRYADGHADKQTDRQTDVLIAILYHRTSRRSNNKKLSCRRGTARRAMLVNSRYVSRAMGARKVR